MPIKYLTMKYQNYPLVDQILIMRPVYTASPPNPSPTPVPPSPSNASTIVDVVNQMSTMVKNEDVVSGTAETKTDTVVMTILTSLEIDWPLNLS